MFLEKIKGSSFRILKDFSLELSPHVNLFIGDNGQGKSSLLESIYCGLRGKSFQDFVKSEFITEGKNQALISLNLKEEEGLSEIKASFKKEGESLKKEIKYNNKKTTLKRLKKFPVFVFTEENLKCIRRGFEQRRLFVDQTLYKEEDLKNKTEFEKILQEKRKLLRDVRQDVLSYSEGKKLLKAINVPFLEASKKLTLSRVKRLEELFLTLEGLKKEFFPKPLPSLNFSYNGSKNKEEILKKMEEDLKASEEAELQTGRVLSSPHRHEILFLYENQDSKTFCSKGQQRIFILSLLASHTKDFKTALLLLDDALSELDDSNKLKFIEFLTKSHCQSLLTNWSEISMLKSSSIPSFFVKKGQILQA